MCPDFCIILQFRECAGFEGRHCPIHEGGEVVPVSQHDGRKTCG
jgi:hypothetical protein